jgi:hypothetical protein
MTVGGGRRAQHQKYIAELDRALDDATDDPAAIAPLLREVLKELRQIRGILGHLAKDVAKETASGHGDDEQA